MEEFIRQLNNHLEENNLDKALKLFEESDYCNIIRDHSWDIVPIVSSLLTAENMKSNKDLVDCCTEILNCIVEKCNPSETVLELLEQIEGPEDDVKFCTIFNVLRKCFAKMDDKTKAIEWCTSTIRSYIESLPLPETESENNPANINQIKNVYEAVILFLEALVRESRSEDVVLRDYLASTLIFLMEKPLCCIKEKELASRCIPERIVTLTSQTTGDLLWFLNIVNKRSIESKFKKKNTRQESTNLKVTLFELNENMSDLAYANFYYYVITNPNLWETVPQVYNPNYVFQVCGYLVIKLLEQELIAKGLNLMGEILKRIARNSLTSNLLELSMYFDLFDILVKVMIYSNNDKERKLALNTFQEYVKMFDIEARYLIVLRLYQISEHSGLLSLTTGICKDCIIECIQAKPPIPYFLGSNLETLLKLACKLQHGSSSDLVELLDEVIAGLNLLRFLFIRDKNNQTGIWNLVDQLEKDYLKPLRKGIDLCRAHWKVKTKDLEEQKKTHKVTENIELENSDAEVTLTVGGENLPAMPIQEKISFCYQAVNGLDVMESILIRVNECIASNPFKGT